MHTCWNEPSWRGVKTFMRVLPLLGCLLLCGCGPGLNFNSQDMSRDEMLKRANLVFIGVIEGHHFDSWPYFRLRIAGDDPSSAKYWKVLRRTVRVETVLRGVEPRNVLDVYEIFWTGGASGDWNFTWEGERALFLVRIENGRYHVVRDWWRSIFPVTSGPHTQMPMDDSRPFWERLALMNWWILRTDASARISHPYFQYNDPGNALDLWRTVKLERGLVRHPSAGVRVPACRELLLVGWGQDECWELLSESDRHQLRDSAAEIASTRHRTDERSAEWWWNQYGDRELRRLLTTMNNRRLRLEFCRQWACEYPGDLDNGCPADQPPPATIVTEKGDIPLLGRWPS